MSSVLIKVVKAPPNHKNTQNNNKEFIAQYSSISFARLRFHVPYHMFYIIPLTSTSPCISRYFFSIDSSL